MTYIRPDYGTARRDAGYRWSVRACYLAVMALAEVPIRDFFLQPEACIRAYRQGRPLLYELFGDWLPSLAPATPPVSYGHVNCLGSDLLFPEDGEVAHTHPFATLDAALERLREPVDWATAGMAPFYLDFLEDMRAAFPGEHVGFGFGAEGPLTTAYELRGEGFFTDLFDEPQKAQEFLHLLTASIVDYRRWIAEVTGAEFPHPEAGGMADDLASFVPPYLYDDFVMPFWEQLYEGVTTGKRNAHIEDLRQAQLPYLEDIGLSFYDPSISHKLDPPMLRDTIRVPFGWRLGSFHYRDMDEQAVRDFVFQAAADGASSVFTIIEGTLANPHGRDRILAFRRAGEDVEERLAGGGTREGLRRHVSPEGRARFWGHFPE